MNVRQARLRVLAIALLAATLMHVYNELPVPYAFSHVRALVLPAQLATVGEDFFLNVWELPSNGQEGPSGQVGSVDCGRPPTRYQYEGRNEALGGVRSPILCKRKGAFHVSRRTHSELMIK